MYAPRSPLNFAGTRCYSREGGRLRGQGRGKGSGAKDGSEEAGEWFEDLRVWQNGIRLVKQIYSLTNEGTLRKDFGFRDQLRRAAVSIPTTIAEGFERASSKEYLYFLTIAKGSAGEVRSLLRVALEVGYVERATYVLLYEQVTELSRMLFNQIQSIKRAAEKL